MPNVQNLRPNTFDAFMNGGHEQKPAKRPRGDGMIDDAATHQAKPTKKRAKSVIKMTGLVIVIVALVAVALIGNSRKKAAPPDDDIAKIMAAAFSKPLAATPVATPETPPVFAAESAAASDTMPSAVPGDQATSPLVDAPNNRDVIPVQEIEVPPPEPAPPSTIYTLRAVLTDGAVIEDASGTPRVVRVGDSL